MPVNLKSRWQLLRSIPRDIVESHNQLVELRKEVSDLSQNQLVELRKEISDLRGNMFTGQFSELKAEITAQLGFSFHDFGRGFAEYVDSVPDRFSSIENQQVESRKLLEDVVKKLEIALGLAGSLQTSADRLANIENILPELRNLLGEVNATVNNLSTSLHSRLNEASTLQSATKDQLQHLSTSLHSRLNEVFTLQSETRNQLQHLSTSLHSRLNEVSTLQLETKNLVTHVITSVHSRLDTIENERFNGLSEQMHELTARVFEQAANGTHANWVKSPEERYEPAERQSFEHWLARAGKEYPQTFSLWHDRLIATQEAFSQTKVGNAAHAGDPRSRLFLSFVEKYATGRVLDVGCGVFGRPYYLSSYPSDLISGLDPLPPVEAPDFEFVQGISEFLPWPAQSFSTVISASSLDHCLSLEHSLAEMRRVLRPEGRLLLWIDSVPGSPPYNPKGPSFTPADQFHLFHFDASWLEPLIIAWGDIVDRIELRRSGYSQVMYCIEKRDPKPPVSPR